MKNTITNTALYIVCILFFSSISAIQAGTPPNTSAKEKTDSLPSWVSEMASIVKFYGSIRINAGVADNGHMGVADNATRFGFEGSIPLVTDQPNGINVLAAAEWGASLVNRDDVIRFSGDPGAEFAEAGNAIYTRLGYVGLAKQWGSISFGKQWSVYSMVAGMTDQFMAFGGEACGQYNANTDGGVSGTGRANQASILYINKGPLHIGIQGQSRTNSTEDKKAFDTYGAAITLNISCFTIGATYNKVRDGVIDPMPDQAKKGDEAMCGAISYENDRLFISASWARLLKHEKIALNDSTDFYYNGNGTELFIKYIFSKSRKWHAATGFNYLRPDKNEVLAGDYDLQYFVLEAAYQFKKDSYAFLTTKIENSHNIDGSRSSLNVFGGGIRFSF